MEPQSLAAAAVDVGRKLSTLITEEGFRPLLSAPHLPQGGILLTPEKLDQPRFLTAAPVFNDPAGFVAYLLQFKDAHSRIFYTQAGEFVAVLDYHEAAPKAIPAYEGEAPISGFQPAPRHGDHVAKLVLKQSPEWMTWMGQNGQIVDQTTFAEFIEDNLADIIEPAAEVMLAASSGLQATTGTKFRQATNLSTGETQFSFEEEVDARVKGREEMKVPNRFTIALRPFMGTDRYRIDCRFRYRIREGLKLSFKALQVEPVVETALAKIVGDIAAATGLMPALGAHDERAMKAGV